MSAIAGMAGNDHVMCLRGVFLGALKIVFYRQEKKVEKQKKNVRNNNTTNNNIPQYHRNDRLATGSNS